MDARDADVVEAIDRVPHDLGGDRRLFRDVEVRCSGARDDDRSVAPRDFSLREGNCPRVGVIRGRRRDVAHGCKGLRLGARDQQRPPAGNNPRRDRGYLGRRFSKPENDFRKSLAQLHAAYRRVQSPDPRTAPARIAASDAVDGGSRVNRARAHRLEQFLQVGKLVITTLLVTSSYAAVSV